MHATHGKKDLLARLELVHAVSVTNRRLPSLRIASQAVCLLVDDDLTPVACRAGIEVGGQGALGDESERDGPSLAHRDLGRVFRVVIQPSDAASNARCTTASTSGDSRPRTSSIRTSSTQTSRCRLS